MQYLWLHFLKLLLSALPKSILPNPSPSSFSDPEEMKVSGAPASALASQEAELSSSPARVLAVGEYLVGDAEDTLLNGHPDIRY
ncbi:hypothetical protein [Hymenobacter cellulosivorans]|uniref:Uncharacterized protein n=1 Tax=Hymenobacter cellulosivorans TaxID=2932249 RepID=A0ABY4FEH2_9BACT|nr:hypothetical protein [Hymenobacter cellulosivorans]UOQ54362.1 hypothetical protein MUN80_06280 [Hymenobacter cellulosivorans]